MEKDFYKDFRAWAAAAAAAGVAGGIASIIEQYNTGFFTLWEAVDLLHKEELRRLGWEG